MCRALSLTLGVHARGLTAVRVTVVVPCVCVCVCVCVSPRLESASRATTRQTGHTHGLSIVVVP